MKKELKRNHYLLKISLMLLLFVFCIPVRVFAADSDGESVSVRIEGIKEQLYNNTIDVSENATVEDVLKEADEADDSLQISLSESQYGDYIDAVNDEKAGNFGGYDGWMFMVNSVMPSEGISDVTVQDGDQIVVYYGDPYGEEGFQYPEMDDTKIEEGILSFTSDDITYDADGNSTETTNPVQNAEITLYDKDNKQTASYETDSDGSIQLDLKKLENGDYSLKISKQNSDEKPLLLRTEFSVTITNGQSGQNGSVWIISIIIVLAVILVSYFIFSKKRKEK